MEQVQDETTAKKKPQEVELTWKKYAEVLRRMGRTLALCWRYSDGYRRDLWRAYAVTLLIEACSVLAPWLVSKLMVRLMGYELTFAWSDATAWLILIWLCWLSWGLLDGVRGAINQRFDNDLGRDLPILALRHMLSLSRNFHQSQNTGQLTAKVIRGAESVKRIIDVLQYNLLPRVTTFFFVIVLLTWLNVWFLPMGIGMLLAYAWIVVRGRTKTEQLYDVAGDREEEADALSSEAVTNALVVQAFCQEASLREKTYKVRDERHGYRDREMRINLRTRSLLALVADQAGWGMFVYALHLLHAGSISFQMLMFAAGLINRFRDEIVHFGWMYDALVECINGVERLAFVLGQKPTVTDPVKPKLLPPCETAEIVFENVGFKYDAEKPDQEIPWALQDINLRVAAGTVLGITGGSGEGKSTLVSLMLQFAYPTAGRILFNGFDLRELAMSDLRGRIGYVEQNVMLFNDTVRGNILFGRMATQEEVEAAAKVAGAHDFIMALPNGYDTMIGDRGARLSGGQRQRLGIARAILKQPSLLILDEATSSLDAKSIEPVMAALERIKNEGRCTMVAVTHQLAALQRLADNIAIVRQGRIAEIGTHEQLLAHNGFYSELVTIQQRVDRQLDA